MFVQFTFERETKNTVRFAEVVAEGVDAVIGTLYIQKAALAAAGITAAEGTTIEVAVSVSAPVAV